HLPVAKLAQLGPGQVDDVLVQPPQPCRAGVVQHHHLPVGAQAHVDLHIVGTVVDRRADRRDGVLPFPGAVAAVGARLGPGAVDGGAHRGGHSFSVRTRRSSQKIIARPMRAWPLAPTGGGSPEAKLRRVASLRRRISSWKCPRGITRSTVAGRLPGTASVEYCTSSGRMQTVSPASPSTRGWISPRLKVPSMLFRLPMKFATNEVRGLA